VDVANKTVVKDINVGVGPQGILLSGNNVFVANTGFRASYGQATVSIIDISTDSVTHTIDVPTNAQDLARSSDGKIHILCTGDYATEFGKIVVLDMYTGPFWNTPALVDTIELGGSPGDIAISTTGKGYCTAWGDGTNGYLMEYDALADTVVRDASNPRLTGPNVSGLLYDDKDNVLWIPTMTVWGGDGFAQKYDVEQDSLIQTSAVLGNGVQAFAVLEPIQESDPWADAVVSFTAGSGSGFGQNFLPENILGPPDPSTGVDAYNPSSNPREILSLGHGGEIILEFTDNKIVNGDGIDFTVFENAFISWDGSVFMEAAKVAVSQDGHNWFEFPFDTTDMSGLAGVTPIADNQNPTDPTVSGGDQFDLESVGLEWASYVRITDLGDYYQEGTYNGDFDLDAVVAVNSEVTTGINSGETIIAREYTLHQNFPNPFNPSTKISYQLSVNSDVQLEVYNVLGQKVKTLVNQRQAAGTHSVTFNATGLASGVYYYKIQADGFRQVRKMMLVR
jgi:hypothetical protein